MAQGALDLAGEQLAVVAEVAFQRVAVDDDSVLVAFARDSVAEVLAVGVHLGPQVGNDDGDVREHLLEFVGQPVDRVDDQRLELVELTLLGHASNGSRSALPGSLVATLMEMTMLANLEALPGADLVQRGVDDLNAGRETAESLLVSIGAPRLRKVGIALSQPIPSPEHKLYLLLANDKGDAAHSAYNALLRRLVSFERAAACAS